MVTLLRELSLFTGYGGMSLGLKLALKEVRTVGYCEIEPYCQEIIKARIRDGFLDDAPIWPDIRTADFSGLRGLVDIVTAGFPCQPHSVAGKRVGALDKRNLWPDTLRVIDDVGPAIVLLENVPGILANGYAGIVVGELASAGYDALWGLLSASTVGAPHVRTRWWCLAYPNRFRAAKSGWRGDCLTAFLSQVRGRDNQKSPQDESANIDDGNTELAGAASQSSNYGNGNSGGETVRQTLFGDKGSFPPSPGDAKEWAFYHANYPELEPAIRRMADGTPHRVDRLKAAGNGVVPIQAAFAIRLLLRMA